MSSRQEYVDGIKSSFATIGKSFTITQLGVLLPFTQWPIIRIFVNGLIGKLWNSAADAAEFQVFMLYIDTRVGEQGTAFEKAAYKNREAQLNGTAQEKLDAEAELKSRAHDLISLKR